MSYIGTYLFDVLGMKPEAAMAYLKGSLIGDRFRRFRIQIDKIYDPEIYDLAPLEEPEYGRVTFSLKNGVITKALCEGYGHELHRPTPWPPPPSGLNPGEVFFLGAPEVFKGNGINRRRELQVEPANPPKGGWRIENIQSYYFVDRGPDKPPLTNLPPRPPPKPKIAPDFVYLG